MLDVYLHHDRYEGEHKRKEVHGIFKCIVFNSCLEYGVGPDFIPGKKYGHRRPDRQVSTSTPPISAMRQNLL